MKLTFASRILTGHLIVVAIAAIFFVNTMIDEIKPPLRQAVEFTLVDVANLMAETLGKQFVSGKNSDAWKEGIARAKERTLDAAIWSYTKSKITLNFYVTDKQGIVLYDSEKKREGQDYSQWRDVYLTLRGQYGARSTQENPDDPYSTRMFIGAPIINSDKEIIGSVTVHNPNFSLQPLIDGGRINAIKNGLLLLLIATIIGGGLSFWLSQSITRLVKYAKLVQQGRPVEIPKLAGTELVRLAEALDNMRQALEGKKYVERYVQQLAHELKTPLAAVSSAAELLEDAPAEVKEKFINNIQAQSKRMQLTIEKMIQLSMLENTTTLSHREKVDVDKLLSHSIKQVQAKAEAKNVKIVESSEPEVQIMADKAMLQLAIDNLFYNAIDFAKTGTAVRANAMQINKKVVIRIENQGDPIPEFATDRLFDRFYSLPRPDGTPKSTGLGLSFVKEIMTLHNGQVQILNAKDSVVAQLEFEDPS